MYRGVVTPHANFAISKGMPVGVPFVFYEYSRFVNQGMFVSMLKA